MQLDALMEALGWRERRSRDTLRPPEYFGKDVDANRMLGSERSQTVISATSLRRTRCSKCDRVQITTIRHRTERYERSFGANVEKNDGLRYKRGKRTIDPRICGAFSW